VRYFSAKYADEMGRPAPQFTDQALENLGHYPWPGNVRELENLIQRLMAMADDDIIDVPDLPAGMRAECFWEESGLNRTLEQVEAEYIRHVLERLNGNKSQAAKTLGIDRKTLREKLKRFGLNVPQSRQRRE
jgi:two-component system response regulator HydG